MKDEYRFTKTTMSLIKYHFVFCPRYRRKIFKIDGLEQRFKEIVATECEKQGIELLELECNVDYVHIYIRVLPTMSIHEIMRTIKNATWTQLKPEFQQLSSMPSLWTKNYLVSTEETIKSEVINYFVNSQKNRP